jgi:ribosomal-protein-alanine N-acetyltransferase
MTELSSQRLIYRTLEVDDVTQCYVDWLNDPQVNRFLETRYTHQTLKSCQSYVAEMASSPVQNLFGIYMADNEKHIGNAKLGFINPQHKSGQLSLFIGEKNCWAQGYATEVIRTITSWGFNDLELKRIEAGCYEENLGSLRAFLKSGYQVEGFLRKSVVLEERRMGSFWLGILPHEVVL